MTSTLPEDFKRKVSEKALELGAALVRTCPTDRWSEHPIQDEAYWPRSIWPWAENAVVLGIPLFAPMVATTPSMVYQELYNTSNRILDDMAYRMTSWLTSMGCRAAYFPGTATSVWRPCWATTAPRSPTCSRRTTPAWAP